MPKGDNPNSKKNLSKGVRFTEETAREKGRRGAAKSNAVQARNKTISVILADFLSRPAAGIPDMQDVAKQYGLKDDATIKEVFVIAGTVGEMKKSSLDSVEKAKRILGEDTTDAADNGILGELLECLKNPDEGGTNE